MQNNCVRGYQESFCSAAVVVLLLEDTKVLWLGAAVGELYYDTTTKTSVLLCRIRSSTTPQGVFFGEGDSAGIAEHEGFSELLQWQCYLILQHCCLPAD